MKNFSCHLTPVSTFVMLDISKEFGTCPLIKERLEKEKMLPTVRSCS